MIVYEITCLADCRRYIGVTVQPLISRWEGHLSLARRGSTAPLHDAIRRFGSQAFVVREVACSLNRTDLLATERALIQQEGTSWPQGYNGGCEAGIPKDAKWKVSFYQRCSEAVAKRTRKRSQRPFIPGRAIIFEVLCRVDGRRFITGTIRSPDARWAAFKAGSGVGEGKHLKAALQKYGAQAFEFRVMACAKTEHDLHGLADQLILQEGTAWPGGLNGAARGRRKPRFHAASDKGATHD